VWQAFLYGLAYLPNTLKLAFSAFLLSLVFGIVIAGIRFFKVPFLARFFALFVTFLKGVPMLLVMFVVFASASRVVNGLAALLHLPFSAKDVSLNAIGIVALTIFGTMIISETIRGALTSVDNGQFEAGFSIGLTRTGALVRIVAPQAVIIAAPVLCNNIIGLIKASALCYMVMVEEVMSGTLKVASSNYKYFEAYLAAAAIYWALCIVIEMIAKILRAKLGKYRTKLA
jgi:L-cystine transport system permease protein